MSSFSLEYYKAKLRDILVYNIIGLPGLSEDKAMVTVMAEAGRLRNEMMGTWRRGKVGGEEEEEKERGVFEINE